MGYRLRGTIVLVLCSFFLTPLAAQERQSITRADECIAIFNDVLRQVDVNYVDTLNYEALTEQGMRCCRTLQYRRQASGNASSPRKRHGNHLP